MQHKAAHATIELRSRHRTNPRSIQSAPCRARPVNIYDGLEDIMWIRGLRGERLPPASYALRPNLQKILFFFPSERDQDFSLHTSGRQAFELDIESAHVQPASCQARPVDVDDDLEEFMQIRGLVGERLPTGSYALRPNLNFLFYFWPSERDRDFLPFVFYTPAALFFVNCY